MCFLFRSFPLTVTGTAGGNRIFNSQPLHESYLKTLTSRGNDPTFTAYLGAGRVAWSVHNVHEAAKASPKGCVHSTFR